MSSEMSKGNNEKCLKFKLMEIIEEELSALNFKGLFRDKNGHFMDIFQNESKEVMEITREEEVCSMDSTADEMLHKLDQVETVGNNGDTWKTTSDSVTEILEEMLTETCIKIENEMVYIVKEEVFSPPNEFPAGEKPQNYEDTESLKVDSTRNIQETNGRLYEEIEYVHGNEDFTAPGENTAKQVTRHRNERMRPDTAYIPPPDDIAEEIKRQCEFFFEDYNIFKNSYLLSNVRRNKEGYVYLSLLASFRRVKVLTRDCRDIAYSLEKSQILELNADRKRVRRKEPFPRLEDTRFGKTVLIFNLPHRNSTPENLKELFSKFGTVIHADIFDARAQEIDAYQSRCLFYHQQIASKIYGVVEFERFDHVVNSLRNDTDHFPKENEMIVVPLTPQVFRGQKRNLRFLRNYHPNARRSYGKLRQNNEDRYNNEAPMLSGDIRNGNLNTGDYYYRKGYYRRRPFRGRKPFIPFGGKTYPGGHVAGEYDSSKSRRSQESRQLKASNSVNTDRFYGNAHRKKSGNSYYEASVHV